MNDAIEVERNITVTQLRQAFVSYRKTAENVYVAYLEQAKQFLQADERVQTEELVKKLRAGVSREEKTHVWRQIMTASVTHLLSYCVLVGVVWCFTCVKVYLLGRYSQTIINAPIQELPFEVDQQCSRQILSILKSRMANVVDDVITNVQQVVSDINVPMSKKMNRKEIESLFTECINSSFESFPDILKWVDTDIGSTLQTLQDEILDICEALDVKSYMHHISLLCVQNVQGCNEGDTQPFAKLLASFSQTAKTAPALTSILSCDAQSTQLCASIYLSGGKEPPGNESNNWESLIRDT